MRSANQKRAVIGLQIIPAAGNGHPLGMAAKIVAVDRDRLPAPDLAGILEWAHHFLLPGVHTDHRQPFAGKLVVLVLEVKKLAVALRVLVAGERLAIGVQSVVHFLQQAPHGVRTDRKSQAPQLAADLLPLQGRPEASPGPGVAGRIVAQHRPQSAQGFRPFFRPAAVRHPRHEPARAALGRLTTQPGHG